MFCLYCAVGYTPSNSPSPLFEASIKNWLYRTVHCFCQHWRDWWSSPSGLPPEIIFPLTAIARAQGYMARWREFTSESIVLFPSRLESRCWRRPCSELAPNMAAAADLHWSIGYTEVQALDQCRFHMKCASLGVKGEHSISPFQISSQVHFQPSYFQAATPTTAKSTHAQRLTDRALTLSPALFIAGELLVAAVCPVATLLPSLVLCTAVVVVLPVVFCRSKYPPASGCPKPAAVTKLVRLNGYRFVRFNSLSGR